MPAYYGMVHTPKRMLHASEIASVLDMYTEQYKPHAKFAAALVKSMSDQSEMYSKTRNGLTRVYPVLSSGCLFLSFSVRRHPPLSEA